MVTIICPDFEAWVDLALSYLPEDVLAEHSDNLVIMSTVGADAYRVGKEYREKEMIVLSDRILPRLDSDEEQPEMRYFIFAVLHEIVHAIRDHNPPNAITRAENVAQEREADQQALDWFNQHIDESGNPSLERLTRAEIDEQQGRLRNLMMRLRET